MDEVNPCREVQEATRKLMEAINEVLDALPDELWNLMIT
jgi:hypothetical protein